MNSNIVNYISRNTTNSLDKLYAFRMTLGSTSFDNSDLVSSINAYLIRGTLRFVDSPESFIDNFDIYYKEWFFEFHCNNKIVDELRFSGTIDIARYIIANANMSIGGPTTTLNDNIVIYCYTKILNNVNISVKGFNSIIGALKGRHSSELSMVSDILDWDPNISYSTGAQVLYNGIKYVALQDSTNIQPDISNHYWGIASGWTRKSEFIRNIWNSFGVDTTNLSYEMLYRSTWMSSDNNYNAYQFTDKTIDVVVNFAGSKLNRCWYNPANITGDKYNKFIELSTNTMFESTNDVRYAYIMFNGARNLTGDIFILNNMSKIKSDVQSVQSMVVVTKLVKKGSPGQFALHIKPIGLDSFSVSNFNDSVFPIDVNDYQMNVFSLFTGVGLRPQYKYTPIQLNVNRTRVPNNSYCRIYRPEMSVYRRDHHSKGRYKYTNINICFIKGGYTLLVPTDIKIHYTNKIYKYLLTI